MFLFNDRPADNYMLKINKRKWCEICLKLTKQNDTVGVVLVSSLLTLNIFPCSSVSFFFYRGVSFTTIYESQELQGKGEGTYVTPHYHFHPLHRH